MPPGDWLNFLLPDNSGELWSALGAATALALFFAARSASQATKALRFEQRPVVYLDNAKTGEVVLRNAGRGVALNAYLTDEDTYRNVLLMLL